MKCGDLIEDFQLWFLAIKGLIPGPGDPPPSTKSRLRESTTILCIHYTDKRSIYFCGGICFSWVGSLASCSASAINERRRVRASRHSTSHANFLPSPSSVYSDNDRRFATGIYTNLAFHSVSSSDRTAGEIYRRRDGRALSQERSGTRRAAECDVRQCDGTPDWNIRASGGSD